MKTLTALLPTAALILGTTITSGAEGPARTPTPPPPQQKIQMLGPGQCLNCHDHDKENQWYSKGELLEVVRLFPEKGANAGHVNSLNQLESPKSEAFAKAVGQADKYDTNGICVRCHATVFNNDANAGVSCESCHGPASAYLQPHQVKGTYDTAVTQYGMTRLVGNIQGWTQQCTNCHVMDDDRLIKAGHPSGDDFDLSKRYQPVSLHFKKTYTPEQVAAISKGEMAGIIYRRRPNAPPPPLPAVATSALPGMATGAPVTMGLPPPPPAAPAPPPAPAVTTAPATAAPATPATPPTATTAKPAAAPAKAVAKPAVPKPAPAIDTSQPPAGSPTSIEPPPPPAGTTPPAAAPAAPAAAPSAPPATPPAAAAGVMDGPWPWVGGALVLIALVAVVMAMRKKA
jgi:hypothetical protein